MAPQGRLGKGSEADAAAREAAKGAVVGAAKVRLPSACARDLLHFMDIGSDSCNVT